jgi:hypothetical protein
LLEPLASEDPKAVQVHLDLVRAWIHLGNELAHLGKDPEASKYFELARSRAEQLAHHDAERLECRQALAEVLCSIARMHTARSRWQEARPAIRQALDQHRLLLERDPRSGAFRGGWSKSLALAADIERALGRWSDAAAAARAQAALWPKTPDKLFAAAADLARTATAAAMAKAVSDSARCAESSLEILRQARAAGLQNIAALTDGPDWTPVRALPGFADLLK